MSKVEAELLDLRTRLYRLENQRPSANPHMRDLADTKLNKVIDGQVPAYNSATGLWEPITPAGITLGCSVERLGIHGLQAVAANTFTRLTFGLTNFTDGNFVGGVYVVPVTGIYTATVRIRLEDNLTPTLSYGAGAHTVLTDGPWFLWADSSGNSRGSTVKRSSIQVARTAEFTAGDSLSAYIYSDGVAVNVDVSGFDVLYQGSV